MLEFCIKYWLLVNFIEITTTKKERTKPLLFNIIPIHYKLIIHYPLHLLQEHP